MSHLQTAIHSLTLPNNSPHPLAVRSIAALFGILLLALPLDAQLEPLYESWRWAHFTERDGLPSRQVHSAIETADGTVWARTFKGLAWYDGYRWHPVGETAGLPEIARGKLFLRPKGGLFACFEGQLYVGDRNGFEPIPLSVEVESVVPRADGSLIILSYTTLHTYRDGRLSSFAGPVGVPPDEYVELVKTLSGTIWLHSLNDLHRLEGESWVREQSGRSFDHLTEDQNGNRFAATVLPVKARGLWTWTSGSPARRYPEGRFDLIEFIAGSADGRLFTGYEAGDIFARAGEKWALLEPLPKQMENALSVGFLNNGDLWVGTENGLFLHQSSSRLWTRWRQETADLRNRVDEILLTRDGNAWFGTDAGVEIRTPSGEIGWTDRIGDVDLTIITALAEDPQGNVWMASGAQWAGAFRHDGRQWEFVGPEQGLGAGKIHRIHTDSQGRLWFLGMAIEDGDISRDSAAVYVYENGRFAPFPLPGGMVGSRAYSFAEGRDGDLWFGTIRGLVRLSAGEWNRWTVNGFERLQNGEWIPIHPESSLELDRIFVLAADSSGTLWFADQKRGLGHIDATDKPRYLTTEDGLINNQIWDLDLDDDGRLWIATRGGLCSYRDGQWNLFPPDSGLDAQDLWPVAAVEDRVYVGTAGKGTVVLDLRQMAVPLPQIDIIPPLIDQNKAVLRWRPVAYRGTQPSARIKTRHRLDQQAWSAWSYSRETTIDHLSPGPHAFQVQATGPFGRIAPGAPAVQFSISGPFYRRPEFFLPIGILLLVIAVLYAVLIRRRRQHTTDLRSSEIRYRSFFEEAPISLWEHDYSRLKEYLESLRFHDPEEFAKHFQKNPAAIFAGMKTIRVLDANRASVELFKSRDRQELIDKLPRIFRRDSFPAFGAGFVELARGGTSFSHETVAYDLDGLRLNVILRWSIAPGSEQNLDRILVSVLDVTPQRQAAEKMRRAMQEAEQASLAKSEFLANMSHEIRTPMNGIIGLAELIHDTDLTPAQHDYLDGIQTSADSLLDIINDILDLSKIEAGKMALETNDISLSETVERVVQTLSLRAREKGLEMAYRIAPNLPDALIGDPVRLKQILINLVSNAVKFTKRGGVTVNISPEAKTEEKIDLHIAVRDTGIGVPVPKQQQIFPAISQADSSTTRQYGGTGLGLSITSHLAQMMDGRIWLESTEGEGSTFHVVVRLGVQRATQKKVVRESAVPVLEPLSLRILLAEDNEMNQKVAVGILEREGHSVTVAGNGREALEYIEREQFDVVLMDVQMPEIDGIEATGEIRRRERETGSRLPVIGLTAHAMSGDRERCLAAGMDDYVTKPIDKTQLFAAFAQLHAESAAGSAAASPPPAQLGPPSTPVLDAGELWERLDNDVELFKQVREIFLSTNPELLEKIRAAVEQADAEALVDPAHELKGMVGNLSATAVFELAKKLEFMGREVDLSKAAEACGQLESAVESLGAALADLQPPS